MQFPLRNLFLLTTAAAACCWLAVTVPPLAILLAVVIAVPCLIVFPWVVMALVASLILRFTRHPETPGMKFNFGALFVLALGGAAWTCFITVPYSPMEYPIVALILIGMPVGVLLIVGILCCAEWLTGTAKRR